MSNKTPNSSIYVTSVGTEGTNLTYLINYYYNMHTY